MLLTINNVEQLEELANMFGEALKLAKTIVNAKNDVKIVIMYDERERRVKIRISTRRIPESEKDLVKDLLPAPDWTSKSIMELFFEKEAKLG